MRQNAGALWLLLACTTGCAHQRGTGNDEPNQVSVTRDSSYKPVVTLAVLPVEPEGHPGLINLINQAMRAVVLPGVDKTIVSPVPLETAQLAVECTESTGDCYAEVGLSLVASRLLFAQVLGGKRAFRIKLTLFDVETRSQMKSVERTYDSDKQAEGKLDELFAALLEGGT